MDAYKKLKSLFGIEDKQESIFEDFDPKRKTLGEAKEDDYNNINAYRAIERFKDTYGYYPETADETIENIRKGSLEPVLNREFPFGINKQSANPLAERILATEKWNNSNIKRISDKLKSQGLDVLLEDANSNPTYYRYMKELEDAGLLPPESLEKFKSNKY